MRSAVEDVDHFVERVVDVIRRPLPWRVHRLEHGQRPGRFRRESLEHDLAAERILDALALARLKKDCVLRHMGLLTHFTRAQCAAAKRGGG